jgi:3-deoxy-D-manno-octulosonic-acid transferase
MRLFYNLGIRLYGAGMLIASIFNGKAKKWVVGRKNLFTNLPAFNREKSLIWFHCASLGEFDQGLPLMHKFKAENPDSILLVTFFSPSGMEFYQKRDHQVDIALYLPLDTPTRAKRFVKHFNPEVTVFVKYEFWINHLLEAKKNGSKLYCISGLFRKDQAFFKWYGGYFREGLKAFDNIFVQNQLSAELLSSIEVNQYTVSGDTRIDKVIDNKNNAVTDPKLDQFALGEKVLVLGSIWPDGENLILPYVNECDLKVIIAPHDISDSHITQILKNIRVKHERYTQYSGNVDTKVLILDTIGQLANAYSYASIAYDGGGFSGSLHNILEPAVFGVPVLFGPKHDKYPEADAFLENGIGFEFESTEEFEQKLTMILDNLVTLKSTASFL